MSIQLLLPQHDQQRKKQREQYLKEMRELYAYQLTYKGNIATINKIPKQQEFSLNYNLHAMAKLLSLLASLPRLILALFKRYPYQTVKDYVFFNEASYPDREFLNNFKQDVYFGLQRVAGINPVLIKGLTTNSPLPENFKAQDVVSLLTQQTYQEALQDGRLYIADYSMLKPLADSLTEVAGYKRYVTTPIALYYRQDNGLLQPLAIQLYATKPTDSTNPIYTPKDDKDWLMAKTYVQTADGTHQELWTHATRIHYVMESIIMCTYRNLDRHHPLFPLLYPHLKYTLRVNSTPLFEPPSPDGKIPSFGKMFACDNDALVKFMGQGMRTYNFKEMAFPNDIKNRNMEDPELYYPYRDDGKLIWEAIHKFVREYINLYYKSDQDVIEDFELQGWGKEIGGDHKEYSEKEPNCGVPSFPTQFNTINEVIETIGNILFIATGHHSCVHFAQYQYAGYVPNMPFSGYTPPSKNFSKEDEMKLFPPLGTLAVLNKFKPNGMAFYQSFIFSFTNFKVNRIGEYDLKMFDGRPNEIIKKYQADLNEISSEIAKRNQKRTFPYSLMDPKEIPNGVTI